MPDQAEVPMLMGCVGISLRHGWAHDYIHARIEAPNMGWCSQGFYLKNVAAPALPELTLSAFSDNVVGAASERWMWGILGKDMKRIKDHLAPIKILKDKGLDGVGMIGAYHQRRVAPLMARALPLHRMTPGAPSKGTVLTGAPITFSKIAQCIKDAMDSQEGPVAPFMATNFRCQGVPQCARSMVSLNSYIPPLFPFEFSILTFPSFA